MAGGYQEQRTVSDHLARAETLVARYLDHVVDHSPVEATRLGLPDRDGELPDLAPEALAARSRDLAVLAAEVRLALGAIGDDPQGDDREARDDLHLLADELAYRHHLLDTRPRFVLDPLAAVETVTSGLHELLRRTDQGPEATCRRVAAAVSRARRVPVLLEQAGTLLQSAPRPHLEVAIQRLPGLLELVRDELPRRAVSLGLDVAAARDAGEVAAEGLEAYGALLDELRDEPAAGWRLGPEEHRMLLRTAVGTAMTPGEIEDRARSWIAEVRDEMAELSAATWSRRFPGEPLPGDAVERIRRTLAAVGDTAVTPDELVVEARTAVEEARSFAASTGLTDLPPADRLRVAQAPGYLGTIAVAFLAPPPPLAPEAGCTYYLAGVPSSWRAAARRAFLREYNPAQLRSLAVHEAYPGHFVQLEHAAAHPRLARRVLARPAFAEGWAVHIEREVLAAGFGEAGTTGVPADDYRITQRKHELRMATDALLDVGVHAGHLTDAEAGDLLVRTALLASDETEGKLTRAKVAPAQLCAYFAGGEEVRGLWAEVRAREGAGFDARGFHQRLLSHGTPTVAIVAAALRDAAPTLRPFAHAG